MSDSNKPVNRIPHETITKMDKWPLPQMGESGRVVSAAKQAAQAEQRRKERIEDVEGPVEHKPMTADQLNQIAEAAEKEGFETGLEKGMAEGLEQGQKKGHEQGKQQAYEETKATLEEERSRLQAICTALMEPMEQQDVAVENVIVDIAVGLAKHLLQQELNSDITVLYSVVHQALKSLPMGASNIRVFVHPDDVAMVQELMSKSNQDWQCLADSQLGRGGCRVESKESIVDYSVERRLQDYLNLLADGGEMSDGNLAPVADFRPAATEAASESEPPVSAEEQQEEQLPPGSTATADSDNHESDTNVTSSDREVTQSAAPDAGTDTATDKGVGTGAGTSSDSPNVEDKRSPNPEQQHEQ